MLYGNLTCDLFCGVKVLEDVTEYEPASDGWHKTKLDQVSFRFFLPSLKLITILSDRRAEEFSSLQVLRSVLWVRFYFLSLIPTSHDV